MQAMLHFIYRDTLPNLEEHADLGEISDPSPCFLTPETMIEYLLTAADRYGLCQLRCLCESRISQGITMNTVAKILELAQRYQASQLKSTCLKFAATNLEGMQYISINYKLNIGVYIVEKHQLVDAIKNFILICFCRSHEVRGVRILEGEYWIVCGVTGHYQYCNYWC